MIAFKWNAFAKRMFLRDLGLSIIYSSAFTLSVVFRLEDEAERAGSLLGLSVTAVLWIYFVYHEIITEFGSAADANEILALVPEFLMGQSLWDRLQRLSLVAVALTTFLDLAYVFAGDGGAAAVASSFALPLVFSNLLFYMQGFEETGVLVSSKAVNVKPRSKSPSPPHSLPPPPAPASFAPNAPCSIAVFTRRSKVGVDTPNSCSKKWFLVKSSPSSFLFC